MDIRFISSLTPDDENRLAPALLAALSSVLDQLPMAYTLRFETVTGRSYQHGHSPDGAADEDPRFTEHAQLKPTPVG